MFITQLPIKCDSGDIWEMFHEAFMGMYVNIINTWNIRKSAFLNFMTEKNRKSLTEKGHLPSSIANSGLTFLFRTSPPSNRGTPLNPGTPLIQSERIGNLRFHRTGDSRELHGFVNRIYTSSREIYENARP